MSGESDVLSYYTYYNHGLLILFLWPLVGFRDSKMLKIIIQGLHQSFMTKIAEERIEKIMKTNCFFCLSRNEKFSETDLSVSCNFGIDEISITKRIHSNVFFAKLAICSLSEFAMQGFYWFINCFEDVL